jgi:WD40 repeat protein
MSRPDERTGSFAGTKELPVEQALLLDEACDAFEAAWRGGCVPDILAALMELAEHIRSAALTELVQLDVYYRRQRGLALPASDYATRFPALDPKWLAQLVEENGVDANTQTTAEDATPTVEVVPMYAGQRFAHFEVVSKIAHGAMGVVYRARQSSPDRLVALKVIRYGEFAGPAEVRRFRQEAEAAAALDHPNIVSVFEVGEYRGVHFYAMRLVEGGSLAARMSACSVAKANSRREARQRQTRVAELVAVVAQAVNHAHQRGILHRDLKPGNILLDGSDVPHVADFGLARRIGKDSTLTRTGAILGTASYMAPEQASGHADVTTAADVYGLGAVLYELLTGRPPFAAADVLGTLCQVREQEPAAPRSVCAWVDRDLETICLKCLEKNPNKRYSSAEALADDLNRWRSGEPILARRAGPLERAVKWTRRNPAGAGLVSVTALFLLAAVGGGVALGYSRTVADKNNELAKANTALEAANKLAETQRTVAVEQRTRAETSEAESWRLLYFARMHQANVAYQAGNIERVIELLTPYREPTLGKPDPRGFEWYYLWRAARGDLFTIRAHPGGIVSVAYSTDGKTIATGGADGTVRLWDAANGAEGKVFNAGPGQVRVTGVAFVPGTTWIAASLSKSAGGEIRVWDVRTLQTVREIKFDGCVNALAVHPEGKHVAAACDDGLVKVVNLETGQAWVQQKEGAVKCVAFSPDGKRLAAGGTGGRARVWDWPEAREISLDDSHYILYEDTCVDDLNFASDGNTLIITRTSQKDPDTSYVTTHQLMAKSPEWFRWRRAETIFVRQARFLSRESAVAVCDDGSVSVLDLDTLKKNLTKKTHFEKVSRRYCGHQGPVNAVAVSPDGGFIATAGVSRTGGEPLGELRVWDHRPHREPTAFRGYHGRGVVPGYPGLSISPDGNWIATLIDESNGEKYVRVCSALTGAERYRVHEGGKDGAVKFSSDGRWLIISSPLGFVVCRADTGAEHYRARFDEHHLFSSHASAPSLIVPVGVSPNGQYLAVGIDDKGTIFLHDIMNRRQIRTWKLDDEYRGDVVFCVTFSPDGAYLAIASNAGLTMWQVETGTLLWRVRAPYFSTVQVSVAFSPDGNWLVALGNDGALVFDAHDGSRLMTLMESAPQNDGANTGANSCEYTADGTRLLTLQGDTLRLWDASNVQELLTLPATRARAAAITADGRRIAYSSEDGIVRVIDVPSPDPVIGLDPESLVEVLFSRLLFVNAVSARLKADPALAPDVRAAALKLAAWYPRSTDLLWREMWCGHLVTFPLQLDKRDEAVQQLRLANEYLRLSPGYREKEAMLNRAVALFHLGQYTEAEEELRSFTIQRAGGPLWTDVMEGYRLGFRVLALIRMGKDAEARAALADFDLAYQVNEPRWNAYGFRKFEDTVRRSVPPPPIPLAID